MERPSYSFYEKSHFVKELKPSNFDPKATWTLKYNGLAAVFFYCAWCPYCVATKDEWESFAKMAGFMRVCAFNCEKYSAHADAIKTDMPGVIVGYPSIVFYKNNEPIESLPSSERTKKGMMKMAMRLAS